MLNNVLNVQFAINRFKFHQNINKKINKKKMNKKLFNSLIEYIIVSGCDKDTGLINSVFLIFILILILHNF
jgi:hypothetical protein